MAALTPSPRGGRRHLDRPQWRQLGLITAGAMAVFAALRLLPTGTNLSHMDFRVDPKATNAIEFCDPLNPQFIPVVAARSPVSMAIVIGAPATAGRAVAAIMRLQTGSGKPVTPEDLLVTHTRRLHLLLIDPSLRDYQHVHPEPTERAGEWAFTFTPRTEGTYRIFGDFTPAATGRGLYASADLAVGRATDATSPLDLPPATPGAESTVVEREGLRYALTLAPRPLRPGQPIDLRFAVARGDGGEVPLEPVMGAFAHLVAFDQARSGFAHLHPTESNLLEKPDAQNPALNFKLTIPRAGRYVIWAQINLGGVETFVPFTVDVLDSDGRAARK